MIDIFPLISIRSLAVPFIASMAFLVGCVGLDMNDPNMQAAAACGKANLEGSDVEKYGTPNEPGPCWGSVYGKSTDGNIEVYQMTATGGAWDAVLTYVNGRLTSVTEVTRPAF